MKTIKKSQEKLNTVIEQLNSKKLEAWKDMNDCEKFLGIDSKEYESFSIRFAQWEKAIELVNNIINN